MVYMITYDLNKPGQDYEGVIEAIKKSGDQGWCHYWESSWLIRSSLTSANNVMDNISPHLNKGDKLLVIEARDHKQGWLLQKEWDYINNTIFG